jgi:phenylalanyl-tRNA synthetase beta chain
LENHARYPLLIDSESQVLSMPPIINSDGTKVSLEVRNFFIDVTGPNETAVSRALRVMVTSLAEMGGKIGTVRVIRPDGECVTPDLAPFEMELDPEYAASLVGVQMDAGEIQGHLAKMRFGADVEAGSIRVRVPRYRSDVMHPVDIIEDVAIAYGYHNIPKKLVPTLTVGQERDIERGCRAARGALIGLGFQEIVTLMSTNEDEHYRMLGMPESDARVVIENPASVNQTMVRTHLLSAVMDTFRINKTKEMPQRVFEIGTVSILDPDYETGARNVRKVACGISGPRAGYAEMRSSAEALLRELDVRPEFRPDEHPTFIEGRSASIRIDGEVVGLLGEVHPRTLENFGLVQPSVLLEIDLSALFKEE